MSLDWLDCLVRLRVTARSALGPFSEELSIALYVAGSWKPGSSSGYLRTLLPVIHLIIWPNGASLIRAAMKTD